MAQTQENIDAYNTKFREDPRHMTAANVEDLKSEKSKRNLWKRMIEEKMQGCRKVIQSMDKAEAELRMIRPTMRGENRKHAYVSREQRLAVGAPVEEVGRQSFKGKDRSAPDLMELWEHDLKLA